jgi:glycosyltransferase involved in cell wall biosynthesis
MKIILIGNYIQDRQESMERFAQMLHKGFCEAGYESEIWRPIVLLGTWFESTNSGLGKWLGYLDKWVIFPMLLRWRILNKSLSNKAVRFHICDHSNAPYLKHLPPALTGITCHDVIAIRGGMGFVDSHQPASMFGKVLQKWILGNLKKSKLLAAVSQLTLNQLKELAPDYGVVQRNWQVIHNAFNADFKPIDKNRAYALIENVGIDIHVPYILHVGSNLPRKNKKLLLNMVIALGDQWKGNICYAGKPIDEALSTHAKALGLEHRVISVIKPDHSTLEALYTACDAFVFPSFSEGFGWPVIEAQACGTPVIASNVEPMPEVSGGAALHADPTKPEEYAHAFLSLNNEIVRNDLIKRGISNCDRFAPVKIIDSYLKLHGLYRKSIK